MALLQVKNLSFTYPQTEKKALCDLSFSLPKGSFTLLTGQSGCGKTTLLKLLKKEIAPFGEMKGEILYEERPLAEIPFQKIGYVSQSPENQIVTDKVWHELAFGLENMGLPEETIRLRVGETASYFGIGEWYHKNTDALSGGQKQLLNLASVAAMRPDFLLLDEPTAQLDPIAASRFLDTLLRLHHDLGMTVLMSEHRLEEAFLLANRVLILEEGKLICDDAPRAACAQMCRHSIFAGFPSAARIFGAVGSAGEYPLSVGEGRAFLEEKFADRTGRIAEEPRPNGETALSVEGVCFRYERTAPDILKNLDLQVSAGEIFSILGANSSGKSTLLRLLAGLLSPYRGKIRLARNKAALLPQDPTVLFLKNTVAEDLREGLSLAGICRQEAQERLERWIDRLSLTPLLDKHPYDLSGGEQQKCALAKLLALSPQILLLDEPTKGLDAFFKQEFKAILNELKVQGVTVIAVTHDVEFAAAVSNRCGLLFDGAILSVGTPNAFFSENHFYTTAASRISRGRFENAVLCEEVIALCGKRD